MHQLSFLIIALLIVVAWLVPVGFSNRRIEGTIIHIRTIPLLARIKRHATPHAIAMGVAAVLVVAGLVSAWWILVTLASFLAILAVPQRYVVTTRGIRTGRGNFRRWTEFAGVYRSRAGARLQTIGRGTDVPIWLSGEVGDDEFVHLLRTLVRDSYKGKLMAVPQPPFPERPQTTTPDLPGIAAFERQQ